MPENAASYRFDSVAVKEPKFEIDGVFLPPEGNPGTVFFCEVQFQTDQKLCERAFAESFLYFYRNREQFSDWEIVLIYPHRGIEQKNLHPYRSLLNSDQVHRVYLDELGDIQNLPLWVGLMVLMTLKKEQAPSEARRLISRAKQEVPPPERRAIIDIVAAIISSRFGQISRKEVEAMLDITMKETRVYQELKQELSQELKQELRQEVHADLIVMQLQEEFGELAADIRTFIEGLPLSKLEALAKALLHFSSLSDLQDWLQGETH